MWYLINLLNAVTGGQINDPNKTAWEEMEKEGHWLTKPWIPIIAITIVIVFFTFLTIILCKKKKKNKVDIKEEKEE